MAEDGFFGRAMRGVMVGGAFGLVAGTITTFWQNVAVSVNRAQVAKSVLPKIAQHMGMMAGTGGTFYAAESLSEIWTGVEGQWYNSAAGGAAAGAFAAFSTGSVATAVAGAGAGALISTIVHIGYGKSPYERAPDFKK